MISIFSKELSFYFRIMERSFIAEEAEDVNGIIKMVIGNGSLSEEWFVHLSAAGCTARNEPYDHFDTQLTMDKEVFIKTFLGIVPMEIAYNKGDVIIEGDIDFSAFLIICFPRPYSYDIWFYLLSDCVKSDKIEKVYAAYNFIINNTQNIIDDDTSSLPLIINNENSIRSVSISDGACALSRYRINNPISTKEIILNDEKFIRFIKGEITSHELLSQTSSEAIEAVKSFEEFCSFFSMDSLVID